MAVVARPRRGALRWWLVFGAGLGVGAAAFLAGQLQQGQPVRVVLGVAALALVGVGGSTLTRIAWERLREQRRRHAALVAATRVDADVSYASLLHPANEVVGFTGRDRELALLRRWCTTSGQNPVVLVTGPGGVGKTRLARHLAHRLQREGWRVWPVGVGGEATATAFVDDLDPDQRLLLVVDYAEARDSAALANLVASLGAQSKRGRPPRLLLLARGHGDWWSYLHEYAGGGRQALVHHVLVGATVLELSSRIERAAGSGGAATVPPGALVDAAARDLAHHLGRPVPAALPTGFPADTPVLKLHVAALLAVLGDNPDGHDDVVTRLLDHEAGYWRSRAARLSGPATLLPMGDPSQEPRNRRLLRDAVGIAALFGAAERDEIGALLRRVPDLPAGEAAMDSWVGWLTEFYPHPALSLPRRLTMRR